VASQDVAVLALVVIRQRPISKLKQLKDIMVLVLYSGHLW